MNIDLRCCDNLKLMAEIPNNTIDLIYCDVLYGTGRDFGDYQDLKPIRSEIENHYILRIKEMHRILKDTGSIYLQMDWHINHWIRCIMDDIFGYDNLRNEIIWHYKRWTAKSNRFQIMHDTLYFYSKSEVYDFNIVGIELEDYLSKRKNKRGWNSNTVQTSSGKKRQLIVYDEKLYKKGVDEGKVNPDNWDNVVYSLASEKIPGDVWDIPFINPVSNERLDYATQKPKKLIERIIKASSNEGDLVADFYAGSFTTAEVCWDLNRRFIGCDIMPNAYEIGKQRIEKKNKEQKGFF